MMQKHKINNQQANAINYHSNQDGFVLVLAMLIMIVLIVIGVTSVTTSKTELYIAGNEKVARQNFYSAESAAYEGAQIFENSSNTTALKAWSLPGLNSEVSMPNNYNTNLIFDDSTWDDCGTIYGANGTIGNTNYLAVDMGVPSDKDAGSLDMDESQIHMFDIYGRSNTQNGETIINIGYKKRF